MRRRDNVESLRVNPVVVVVLSSGRRRPTRPTQASAPPEALAGLRGVPPTTTTPRLNQRRVLAQYPRLERRQSDVVLIVKRREVACAGEGLRIIGSSERAEDPIGRIPNRLVEDAT